MVETANNTSAPLEMDAFGDKPTIGTQFGWEKWRTRFKLATLAKENKTLNTLLSSKPETAQLSL